MTGTHDKVNEAMTHAAELADLVKGQKDAQYRNAASVFTAITLASEVDRLTALMPRTWTAETIKDAPPGLYAAYFHGFLQTVDGFDLMSIHKAVKYAEIDCELVFRGPYVVPEKEFALPTPTQE